LSISWHLAVDPPPALLALPPDAASLDEAHAAIELWEHYSRKVLDPAQRLAVEVMMAEDAHGRWAASTTGREMPRQNGKGDEIEVVELWGLVQRSEAILHTVHDAVLLASQAQQRMLGLLDGNADLRRRVKRKWQGTGQQMIEMRNGGVIWYRTRTSGGGRGVDDVDRLVIDEAQHATEEHLSAVAPTLLANSNPQMNAMGTAGLARKSSWWWSVRRRALSPDPGTFGYVGHTAEDVHLDEHGAIVQSQVDVNDRALWRRANPSIVAGRGQGMPFLEEQLRRLGPRAFAQEHLGVWDPEPVEDRVSTAFDSEQWDALAEPDTPRGTKVVFGVDVGVDRLAHVAVVWKRPDRCVQVMLADTNLSPLDTPGRLSKLATEWKGPVMLGGPAASLDGEVRRSKVMTTAEFAASCGRFDDMVRAGTLRHGNQPALNLAVSVAEWRTFGQAGERALQLSNAPEVGPLAAVIRALHGLLSPTPPAKPRSSAVNRSGGESETADLSTLQF